MTIQLQKLDMVINISKSIVYEEIDISASSKTAMICKLAQAPPEIWMTLSVEAKTWLLNERKRQQQDDDKMKKSSSKKDTIKVPEKDRTNSSNMPN
jgi:hypothetical protein